MKILLDECVTKKLKRVLEMHEVYTVTQMKWNGVKNGNLMQKCEENNFDILLTIDKNILHQHNVVKHNISVVIFNTGSSKFEILKGFITPFLRQIAEFKKRKAYFIENG